MNYKFIYSLIIMSDDTENGFCVPAHLKDIIVIVIYPPLWVFLKEIKSSQPFSNIGRVIINFVLTCAFYFPGLMHALSILREEGTM